MRYLTLLQPAEGEDGPELDVQLEVDVDESEPEEGDIVLDRGRSIEETRFTIPSDPTVLSYLLSGIIQVDQPRRQALLEADTTVERMEELLRLVEREVSLLERRLRIYNVDPRMAAIRRN